jgi:ribosomal protein S18 acetylase RimI-like enzyme
MALTLEPLPADEYAEWREGAIARRAASPRSRGIPAALAAQRAREVFDRLLPVSGPPEGTEVLAVDDGGLRAGSLFLLPTHGSVQLGDLRLPDPAYAPAVRELVVERLRHRGVGTLGIGVTTGDPAAEALVDGAGFELVATQMQLDLTTAPPPADDPAVTVRPMTSAEVSAYLANTVETFADETMAADPSLTRESALASSREVHDGLLPQGLDTPGHDLLVGLEATTGRRVGITWLFHEERAGFVYDVEVDAAERGKGYGRGLMAAADRHLRGLGMEVLGLNVFGHNHVAHALYTALGYDVVDRILHLALSPR